MAVLSGNLITQAVESGELFIDPFDPVLVKGASYDLRLHSKILASPLGPNVHGEIITLSDERPVFSIHSGQMVGVLSAEILTFPLTISGRFGIRSDFARHGLLSFGGLQLDPGWKGRLYLGLLNVGPEPIPLTLSEPLFSVEFSRLEEPAGPYEGSYQDQEDFPNDQVKHILSARTTSFAEIPLLRQQISLLSATMEAIFDWLPDPDQGMELKAEVEANLRQSLERSPESLLTVDEMRSTLGL